MPLEEEKLITLLETTSPTSLRKRFREDYEKYASEAHFLTVQIVHIARDAENVHKQLDRLHKEKSFFTLDTPELEVLRDRVRYLYDLNEKSRLLFKEYVNVAVDESYRTRLAPQSSSSVNSGTPLLRRSGPLEEEELTRLLTETTSTSLPVLFREDYPRYVSEALFLIVQIRILQSLIETFSGTAAKIAYSERIDRLKQLLRGSSKLYNMYINVPVRESNLHSAATLKAEQEEQARVYEKEQKTLREANAISELNPFGPFFKKTRKTKRMQRKQRKQRTQKRARRS